MGRPNLYRVSRRPVGTGAELGKLTARGIRKRLHWNRRHHGTNGNRIRNPVGASPALRHSADLVDRSKIPGWLGALETDASSFLSLCRSPIIVLAIAGVQWIWSSDRLTVIYLLDQSDSIPIAKRQLMLDYAIESVKKHRRTNRNDRAGLIIFGREASIELPPLDEDLPNISRPEANIGRTDATNLECALKLAQASFLEDSSKRIVILTDGNQNARIRRIDGATAGRKRNRDRCRSYTVGLQHRDYGRKDRHPRICSPRSNGRRSSRHQSVQRKREE